MTAGSSPARNFVREEIQDPAAVFLDGFTMAGMFGWLKMPGAPMMFSEESWRLEDSQFREFFEPFLTKPREGLSSQATDK